MTSDEVRQRIARAHAELQAIADEHVESEKGMGQDIALADLNALRDGAEAAWDEEPLLHRDWQTELPAYRRGRTRKGDETSAGSHENLVSTHPPSSSP